MEERGFLYKSPNHAVNLNNMRLTGKLCDVTIKVEDKEIRAHKLILAANLKYFESMFLNEFKESTKEIITMKNVGKIYLELLISFAYTGQVLLTSRNALGLLEVANYLGEEGIKEACIEFLKIHLKHEEACKVYVFAHTIDCLSLKNAARKTILSHFEDCSQTKEYLDLDYDSLKNIFSETGQNFVISNSVTQSLKAYFESIMRWVIHDVKNRSRFITELLDLFEITRLPADYLLEYLCESTENQGYDNITKAVMSCYRKKNQHTKHREVENLAQRLIILGNFNNPYHYKLHYQSYNFVEKKWSRPRNISHPGINMAGNMWNGRAIIKNKLYCNIRHRNLDGSFKMYIQAFNPIETESSMISFDENVLLSSSSFCACSRFLYLCGGENWNKSKSSQALKYDPETNCLKILPPMRTARQNVAAIFYQGCLHVLGGFDGSSVLRSVEKYDPDTEKWMSLAPMCEPRRFFGVGILNDKLYACGGEDTNSVEVYEPATRSWRKIASMRERRCALFLVAHQGKLLAIGGNAYKTIETYDPDKNQWQIDHEMSSGLEMSYGTGGLIASDCIADVN